MKSVRIIRRVLVVVLAAVLLAGLAVWGMAGWAPSSYRPANLTAEQQEYQMKAFVNHITDFWNKTGAGHPFTWSITADQANAYLASADQIASLPYQEPIYPTAEMARGGFVGPAVAMHNDVLTLMVRAKRYNKVFSADVKFDFDDEGKLTVRVVAVRIGAMPLPRATSAGDLEQAAAALAERLAEAKNAGEHSLGPVPISRFAELLKTLVDMLAGQYVRPEVRLGRHRVLINRIEITPGRLTIHAMPPEKSKN